MPVLCHAAYKFHCSLCSHTCWLNIIYSPISSWGSPSFWLHLCTLSLRAEIKLSESTSLQIPTGNKVKFPNPTPPLLSLRALHKRARSNYLHFTGTGVEAQRTEAAWQKSQMRFSAGVLTLLICGLVSWSLPRMAIKRNRDGRTDYWSALLLWTRQLLANRENYREN